MLERFDHDGIELIIDTETGESYASISGYARMTGVATSTVRSRLKGVDSNLVKEAQIQTAGGLQGARLIPEDLICEWMPNDNPELDKQLRKLGVRGFMHKLAGFEIKSTAVQPPVDNSMQLLFAEMAEMKKMFGELIELKEQTKEKDALILSQSNELSEYRERERILEEVYAQVPGLKMAIECVKKADLSKGQHYPLKDFIRVMKMEDLTRGQRINISRMVGDFLRIARIRGVDKNSNGQSLFHGSCFNLVGLAIAIELGIINCKGQLENLFLKY